MIGAKRNKDVGVPLKLMLKGETFSKYYWEKPHLGLVDVVRQRGFPPIFHTEAPYEWTFPYHVALLDAMKKAGKPRQE
eukprot:12424315-Karenia_brevis.AAC.1